MEYRELEAMTVAQLCEVAAGIEGFAGYTQMRKENLLKNICKQLKIDPHAPREVVGVDRASMKKRIQALKGKRDAAVAAKDPTELKRVRRRIHRLKRRIRRITV
jgi:CII-binding regulator of phage lambda lysogenization HflD